MDSGKKTAYRVIVLMGIVSLFGDITYEGARSITGPYMATLGAGAAVVGFVSGLGEFMAYGLRLASGYFADRTRAYWPLTFLGYGLMASIPFLALAGNWQVAAVLIILERLGKAVRTPARDAILSHATSKVGRGWGFGLHEFLDQLGAITGPLIFITVFYLKGHYALGFNILWIPAILSLVFLVRARMKLPQPELLESDGQKKPEEKGARAPKGKLSSLSKIYWQYAAFTFFTVAGVAHFQLISWHLKSANIATNIMIPFLYVVAMGSDALSSLAVGKLYDRMGFKFLMLMPIISLPLAYLAFMGGLKMAVLGVVLWGTVIGTHETMMRAAIADLTGIERRGLGYGIFNTVYGVAFLLGSGAMGLLYEASPHYLVAFSVLMEIIAMGIFFGTGFSRRQH